MAGRRAHTGAWSGNVSKQSRFRPRTARRDHAKNRRPQMLFKKTAAALLAVCACACVHSQTPTPTPAQPQPAGWVLDWSDEFDGAALDHAKWVEETGGNGWGNQELEF